MSEKNYFLICCVLLVLFSSCGIKDELNQLKSEVSELRDTIERIETDAEKLLIETTELIAQANAFVKETTPRELMFFDNIGHVRGVTGDENPAIFSLKVSIGCEDKDVIGELTDRKWEIQNLILLHISKKKQKELTPAYYGQLQEELKVQINHLLLIGKIKVVVFREFVVS